MIRYALLFFVAVSFLGCKTVHYQKSEILNRGNKITLLKERIDQAIGSDVDILAPKNFEQAKVLFDRAVLEAQKSENSEAGVMTAESGLVAIEEATNIAKKSRYMLGDALNSRSKAQKADAHVSFGAEFDQLDRELKEAGKAIEAGNKKEGLEKNATLATGFSALEVKALKENISERAEKAYADAVQANAKNLAPLTLENAKNELDVAKQIIDNKKQDYDKAQYHAERAQYLAKRAKNIANLLTGFKKEKLTQEQIILWYQDQLAQIHQAVPTDIRFDTDNKTTVLAFEQDLVRAIANLNSLQGRAVDSERKMAQLSEKLLSNVGDKGGKALFEKASTEEHFREISALFGEDEAEVIKRGNDIVIRSHGFYFPVGQSNLLPRNFSLLNKIVTAIVKFPKARIEVEGDTDSTGSKSINMRLSGQRAKNIADFLVKVAGIDAHRVSSFGLGDERPIASNANQAGRDKNRRIEVIIKSDS